MLPLLSARPARALRLLCAAFVCLPVAALAGVRILRVQPTVLFPDREPLAQIAWLEVENPAASPAEAEIAVEVEGRRPEAPQRFTLPPGLSRHDVQVPDLAAPARVRFVLRAGAAPAVSHEQDWRPQRKWKVFLVKSSHEDIGYEDFLWKKQSEIADFIDLGRRLAAPIGSAAATAGRPQTGGYRYWLETLLFPRYYEEERPPGALRELVENAIKPGFLPLGAAPNGIHTHWLDYEELARVMYPARRDMKDRFGLDLDTMVIVDNPSFSWSSVTALAGAGCKYAIRFGQPWRTGGRNSPQATGLPPVFWWVGPDDHSRVLFAWRHHYGLNFWFGQTERATADLSDLGALNVQRELAAVESGEKLGPYPWDALLVPSYQDHELPAWDNRGLRRWRTLYRYPDIRITDPRDFMVEMEKTHGDRLPVLRGDLNNYSADYAAIDPVSFGGKRRASRLLPFAESLAVVASVHAPAFTLGAPVVAHAYQRLFDYAEHSWPTKPPARDVHQFNAQWGKLLEGERALADTEALLDRALASLAAQIPTGASRELAVFNPLAHPRTDLVFTTGELAGLVDGVTGAPVPTQPLADGRTVFLATDVPAFGYKTYRLAAAGSPPAPAAPRAGSTRLENEFYTVTFDPQSGAVSRLRDRQLDRELLDPAAAHQFNQLVWVSRKTGESREGADYAPRPGATFVHRSGPVADELIATYRDSRLGGATVTQTVRLYAGLKRLDVENDLRHVGVMSSPRSSDRYRQNVFYAFPFQVENFTARAEYAGGIVRPYEDQLRWGSHDYLCANRWAEVAGPNLGVTLAPHHAPIVHFGAIRYNEFSTDYRPARSHLYSYAWSNRMDGLATLAPDDMNTRVAYSFTSHAGDAAPGASARFGWSVASQLFAHLLPAGQRGPLRAGSASFLSVHPASVHLTVLKESARPGEGWVLRLVETSGQPVEAVVEVPGLPFDRASLCDLVENEIRPLPAKGNRITVPLRAHGFATVRLTAASSPSPAAVSGVALAATADDRVELRWQPVPGAVAYHVFRARDAAEPPTAHSLVGRTAGPGFTDTGLNLDTTYHYRVAALGPGHRQGPVSSLLTARTARENRAPPSPVAELGVVRQAGDRLMVCWRRVPEPDVARYLVFRGDRPDFDLAGRTPVGEVPPGGYYLEHFVDRGLTPGTTYYYRVVAEDWALNRQGHSPVAAGTTPRTSP